MVLVLVVLDPMLLVLVLGMVQVLLVQFQVAKVLVV
jgi:hypothetical protein